MTTTERPKLDKWSVLDQIGWDPHPGQLKVAESPARHRVVSAGRRWGKSDVGGHELVPEALATYTMRNELRQRKKRREFWVVGPEYCADIETEILTIDGWKRQHQLEGDEIVLTQDPDTGLAAWQQMDGVNVFHANHRYIYESEFRGHSSATTGEHRWLIQRGKPGTYYSKQLSGAQRNNPRIVPGAERVWYDFVTTEELDKYGQAKIFCAQPVINLPPVAKYEDAFVELVAWYWTEGQQWGHGIAISQNEGPHFDRLRAACQSMIGPECSSMREGSGTNTKPKWRVIQRTNNPNQKAVAISKAAADPIREVCRGKDKVVTPQFIASLTQAQLELFIRVSIWADADNDWEYGGDVEIGQNVEARIDSLQMACQLAGLKTQKHVRSNKYGPWYVLSIYAESRRKIGASNVLRKSEKKSHNGIVWCPTTPNGTWLARRRGSVYFTGNSDAEKEFRVVYNELRALEVPFDRPGTYNNPETGLMHISLWEGTFQVAAKSAKHPETLVGEGLHGAILAEAAKLKEKVWTKFIRPTLADFNGWSLHTSTPEGKNWFYENWKRGQDPNNPDWASWRMPSWMNPYVYKGETRSHHVRMLYEMLRLQSGKSGGKTPQELIDRYRLKIDPEILSLMLDLTEEAFNQEIAADFTEFVGKVFKNFDEEVHVADLKYKPGWDLVAAVDYGFTNPNVWLLIQVGPWGEVEVLDEVYEEGLSPEEFAAEIARRGLCPPGVRTFYPDPASPGDTRVLENKLKVRATGNTGGDLKFRLDAIRDALKLRPAHLPDDHPEKMPQLRFDRKCVRTINDMAAYRYPEKREQSSTLAAEQPMKKDDHGPEALGRFFKGHFGTADQRASRRRVRKARIKR